MRKPESVPLVIIGMMGVMAGPLEAPAEAAALSRDFGAWMQSEQRRVFLLCWRFLGDRDEADTATQEVFLKAWQAFNRADAPALDDPAKWLTRVAVNTCLDRLRSRRWQFWKRRPNQEDEAAILAAAPSARPTAEDEIFARQIATRLAEALDRLSVRQRTVFVLRHYEDSSLQEIAGLLGLDVGTVKAHLARAVGKLRQELRDLYWKHSPARDGAASHAVSPEGGE